MTFSIQSVAREYVYTRFPQASEPEKEKIVKDWEKKMINAQSLVVDFKKRVGDVRGKKIIDLGCGNGCISIAFALEGAEVYGVEIEEELVSIAKGYAASCNVSPQFTLYDGEDLPHPNDFFDYAVSTSVLEHTTYPVKYLCEAYRVLKRGGCMYLGFPNKLWPKETHTGLWFLTYVPAFLRPMIVKICRKNPLTENNLHFYTYFGMKKMLTYSGDWRLIKEYGESKNRTKILIKKILSFFGLSYKAFLPHILVVLQKNEK